MVLCSLSSLIVLHVLLFTDIKGVCKKVHTTSGVEEYRIILEYGNVESTFEKLVIV